MSYVEANTNSVLNMDKFGENNFQTTQQKSNPDSKIFVALCLQAFLKHEEQLPARIPKKKTLIRERNPISPVKATYCDITRFECRHSCFDMSSICGYHTPCDMRVDTLFLASAAMLKSRCKSCDVVFGT